MYIKRHIILILSTILLIFRNISAQFPDIPEYLPETAVDNHIFSEQDTLYEIDLLRDTLIHDVKQETSATKLDDKIEYNAKDSLIFGLNEQKIFLYGDAYVKYMDKELKAAYIEYDMSSNIVFAKGLPDSTGEIAGRPEFKDGSLNFEAQTMRYNFKTRKGYIEAIKTEQEGGFLHSSVTKQDQFGNINMKNGMYSTCDLDHPHFYVALTKAKSIPGDKIVSGPAYLVIEDIPLPIGIPFGFFPNTKTNTSGILIPQYGEENRRGFYLRNGGYYLAINDYINLTATGDIYTNGTWGARLSSDYRIRYRFNGNINLRYYKNVDGFKDLPNYNKSFDYSIMWSHNQDAKANPNQNFRASVNLSTNKFDRNHSRILTNALTNTKQSSISYQKTWPNSPFNFSTSFNHSQNSNTGSVDLNFPKANLNMNRIYPFRSKKMSSKRHWYDEIQLSYTGFFDNRIRTVDSLLFTNKIWDDMNMGYRHEVPVSWNYKPKKFKIFTLTPNFRYTGMLYRDYIEKHRILVTEEDTAYYMTVKDTIHKLSYAHGYYPGISASLTPKVYGLFQFTGDGKVQSIRHVMSPNVSFSYIPDMGKLVPEYYRELRDEDGTLIERYSIYENGMFGTPSLSSRQRTMSFSLNNNVEMKVKDDKDTANKITKVKILDLNFMTSANLEDSILFRPVSFNGNTSIFNKKLNLNFRGSFDPYAIDERNRRINKLEFSKSGKIARLTSFGFSTGFNFSSSAKKGETTETTAALPDNVIRSGPPGDEYDRLDEDYYNEYVDFNIPWSLRIDYNFNYSKMMNKADVIQTFRITGDFSLTSKWKIGYNTGFDFKTKQITTSSLSIHRDLHCWEMNLSAVPFGYYKSFNFQINVKSAVLKDLKYNKRIPWQDNF